MENVNRSQIELEVLKGIKATKTPFAVDAKYIECVIKKVLIRAERGDLGDVQSYAYVAGMNLARSIHRKNAKNEERLDERILNAKKRIKAEKQASHKAIVKAELEAFIAAQKNPYPGLLVLRLTVFEGYSDSDLVSVLPETTPGQRYQWKLRAIRLILEEISDDSHLAVYLSEKTNTRTKW